MTMYQRNTVHSSDDIRAIVDHAGGYFFCANTMRFWRSRLLGGIKALDGHDATPGARFLFLTSDRLNGPEEPRAYILRMASLGTVRDNRPSVDIDTVASFPTVRDARRAMRDYVPTN